MKKVMYILVSILLCLSLTSCDEIPAGKAKVPESSSHFKGENYEEVITLLKNAGFSNIETEPVYDIFFNWDEEGEVSSVNIGDVSKFKKDDIFDSNTSIKIIYRMRNENDPEKRTYNGVVYDRVIYNKSADGLRANVETYFFFSESEHKAFSATKTTAGGIKKKKRFGTYDGSFDDVIEITYEQGGGNKLTHQTDGENDYWIDYSERKYSEKNVESCLNTVYSW